MLKGIFDALQMNTYVLIKANAGKKARRLKVPKPWPGPDQALKHARQQEAQKPRMTVADLRRALNPFSRK